MKGVMKVAQGEGNVEVRELAEPVATPGHVVIAVAAAGICGTDLHIYHDEFASRPPVVLGHEVAGTIAALGDGVSDLQPGEAVTTETYFSTCGHCRWCRDGRRNLCPQRRSIGSGVNGGFTSYVLVPARNVHRLPPGVSLHAGALTEPLACVVHGVLELSPLRAGDTVVIAGPGAIGLLTLQVARAAGARAIVLGTSVDANRLALAKELGAAAVVVVDQESAETVLQEQTDGVGADIVYECSGAERAAQSLLKLVRRGGHYAQVGLFGRPVAWDLDQVCYKELTVSGSNASVPSAWERALALLGSGMVRTEPLITDTMPITEWRAAFDLFGAKSGVKTLLVPVG
jgi:L-iditol 2-dehydrogenase